METFNSGFSIGEKILGFAEPPSLRWRGLLGLGLLSLALYLSGLLTWLTPLPILYAYKYGRQVRALVALLPAVGLLWLCYDGLMPLVTAHYGAESAVKFFFWLPGIGLSLGESAWNPAIFGISYYLFFALMGLLLGEFESQPYSATRLILQTLLLLLIVAVLWIGIVTYGIWDKVIAGLEAYLSSAIREFTKLQAAGEEVRPQWEYLQSQAPALAHYFVRLLPAMLVNAVLFMLWLNILVARKIFGSRFFSYLEPLKRWRFPFAGIWTVIVLVMATFLDAYVLKSEGLSFFAINGLIVLALVYFFQGLAILAYYFSRWSLSPLIRIALYALLVLFFQPVSFLLMAFGLFDAWFDFRKLNPKSA
ncbi:MAG TPA: hypothetical protein DF383_00440 [Deltaproteobacteria bacterium]|nr:hypothetical protein [Deltaproteobacteria bacterium]